MGLSNSAMLSAQISDAVSASNLITDYSIPLIINSERYGNNHTTNYAYDDNVRAAGTIINAVHKATPQAKVLAYAPAPRMDLARAIGRDGNSGYFHADFKTFYENENRMRLEWLARHADGFIVDCFVRWNRTIADFTTGYQYWNRYAEPVVVFEGFIDPSANIAKFRAWKEWVDFQARLCELYGGGLPCYAWTSSSMIDNGGDYMSPNPSPGSLNPVWDAKVSLSMLDQMLDYIATRGFAGLMIFEGWSNYKYRQFTSGYTPDASQPMPSGGFLEWTSGPPWVSTVAPYIL